MHVRKRVQSQKRHTPRTRSGPAEVVKATNKTKSDRWTGDNSPRRPAPAVIPLLVREKTHGKPIIIKAAHSAFSTGSGSKKGVNYSNKSHLTNSCPVNMHNDISENRLRREISTSKVHPAGGPMSAAHEHFLYFVHFDGGIFAVNFCHVRENGNFYPTPGRSQFFPR